MIAQQFCVGGGTWIGKPAVKLDEPRSEIRYKINGVVMGVTVHKGSGEEHQTDESASPGYPRGVWPAVISPFCADPYYDRHKECSLCGCTCSCHASVKFQA